VHHRCSGNPKIGVVLMKTVEQLQAQLRRMREKTDEYSRDPNHDAAELVRRRSECANLWGAIECHKRGETPVSHEQAKFLE
jgi:hypothetical protein